MALIPNFTAPTYDPSLLKGRQWNNIAIQDTPTIHARLNWAVFEDTMSAQLRPIDLLQHPKYLMTSSSRAMRSEFV